MRTLRTQLLASHLALALLMVLVMAGAVTNFLRLGRAIDRLLADNYQSVLAALEMKEALERMDGAAAFHLDGQRERARRQYEMYRPRFEAAYQLETENITEAGEKEAADDIGRRSPVHQAALEKLLYAEPALPAARARAYYFGVIEPESARLKRRCLDVLELNQRATRSAGRRAKAEAVRATYVSAAVTAGAFVLAIALSAGAVRAALAPLARLARHAEEVGAGHLDRVADRDGHRGDEIGALAQAFDRMTGKLRDARHHQEQRLQRAESMSHAALESLYHPVIATDHDGRVVHLNRAAEALFGSEERAAGRPAAHVLPDERIVRAVERAIRQEHVSAEEGERALVTLLSPGGVRTYRLRATPMRDAGALLGAVAVLEDVTHLRELDRLKTEFVGVASHELRTPVTSLLLSVQLLQEGAAGPLTPEQQAVVAAQRDDLERLERLMRDLLDLTRLEAGVTPPRLQAAAPRELAEAALASVRPQAAAKGLALRSDLEAGLPPVQADRSQIGRVLVNLLGNAVRHTPAGGEIVLRACREDGAPSVTFEVRDTGAGIPTEYLPRIFERFVQVPGATRGGAGLGLAIVQTIVRAHGGEVRAGSEPGRGSSFSFRLPAAAETRDATAARAVARRNGTTSTERRRPWHGF